MLIASTKSGLSENYVLQEYGRSGHKKFMKLAANGYLINKNGNFLFNKSLPVIRRKILAASTKNKAMASAHPAK